MPRASGSIRFSAHHLFVTLDSCAAWALGEPGRELYRRSLRRNFPIDRLAAQDCEGDARHLVGERHGDKLEGLLVDQLLRPYPQRIGVRLAVKQHRMRTHDKQFAQIAICPSSKCARALACRPMSSAWVSVREKRRIPVDRQNWTRPEWSPPSPRR